MTIAALLPLGVRKESRALSLAWLACLVAMIASAVTGNRQLRALGIPAYFFGTAALGALSIGHEYSHRTLALLLSQPARRERLLLVKLGVLAGMLLTLCAAAYNSPVIRRVSPQGVASGYLLATVWLPVLCGLFLAPWLTMICRSPIAGTVFTVTIPGILAVVGELIGVATYGITPEADHFRFAIIWRGTLGLCAIGAVMSWRMFMRLEAIDSSPDVRLPQWLRWTTTSAGARPFTKRQPLWLLVKKELRLQQLAIVVAGLYILGWLTVVSLGLLVSEKETDAFNALMFLYGLLISLLIGSLASAEERQLGTLEWQMILPVATWKQWAVKSGVALSLAMLLAFALPALLVSINPTNMGIHRDSDFLRLYIAVPILLFTAGSLYVSSLCSSGLKALLMSLPAALGVVLFVNVIVEPLGSAVFTRVSQLSREIARPRVAVSQFDPGFMSLLLAAVLLAMLLRFAMTNHRSAERAASRVWEQGIWMGGCVMVGMTVIAGVAAFSR